MEFHNLIGYGLSTLAIVAMIVMHLDSRKRKKEFDELSSKLDDCKKEKDKAFLLIELVPNLREKIPVEMGGCGHTELSNELVAVEQAANEYISKGGRVGIDDLSRLAHLAWLRGKIDLSEQYLSMALSQAEDSDKISAVGIISGNLGLLHYDRCQYDRALSYFGRALEINRTTGHRLGEAGQHNNIGLVQQDLGLLDKASVSFETALRISQSLSDRRLEAAAIGNLGKLQAMLGKSSNAHRHCLLAYQINRDISNYEGMAAEACNLGLICKAQGHSDDALKYLKKALAILDEHDLAYGRDVIENAISEIEAEQKSGDTTP